MDITEKNEDIKKNAKKTDKSKGQNESTKLKILCLHGYRQTSTSFYEKTGAFRKIVGKKCEMKYINAPHLVPDDADQAKESFENWLQTFVNIFFQLVGIVHANKARKEIDGTEGYSQIPSGTQEQVTPPELRAGQEFSD